MELVSRCAVVDELLVSECDVRAGQVEAISRATNLPDSFFTMFRNEITTPYTSFASSSKGNPVLDVPAANGGLCSNGAFWVGPSFKATMIPVLEDKVLRGLLNAEFPALVST